jgi:prolyl-tRNA synthetase
MRMSQLLLQTLREAPGEARTPGYQLLLRGGFVKPVSGGFAFLPLGSAVQQRLEEAARGLLRSHGGQPVALPLVRPAETGLAAPEEHAVRFRDRAQREMLLSASHDAVVLGAAIGVIRSYRQLPILLYETWQRFGDEDRPAGGLLGAREGRLVDAYGMYRDAVELEQGYEALRHAITDMLDSWEVDTHAVICAEAPGGHPLGHALVLPSVDGEQLYAHCSNCGYAAAQAVARVWLQPPAPEALLPMRDVETPNCKTIAALAGFLGIPASRTAKVVFLIASYRAAPDQFVFAVVRGDTALSEERLKGVLGAEAIGPATEAEIRQAGAEPGYGSPVGLIDAMVVVDTLASASPNLVAGANRAGYHTLNVNVGRDYEASLVADIATAQDGSPCAECGSPLVMERGVALAEMWQAGDRLSRALSAAYLDSAGQSQPLALGRFRVHVDRVIAALAERHHDANGLTWPASAAPYRVHLMTVGKATPEVGAAAERIYAELTGAGLDVLFDDRDERAGVKFNDADLLGAPWRVAVGERGLQTSSVEVKARSGAGVERVGIGQVLSLVS